jgi:HAE1 family hydrophobic/amphiphilic exporter-1
MEKVDEALVPWTGALRAQAGVRHVQVRSQIGGASIEAAFDPEVLDRKALREAVRGIPLEGGFVYIPEGGAGERVWELKVSGEDDRVCRELAGELASASAAIPIVEEAVLNFKEGSTRLVLRPLRERMPGGGIDFSIVAGTLRGLVHGPVAYKRSDPAGGETDLRVRGFSEAFPSREDFEAIAFAGPDGGVYALKDLVSIEEKADSARIYRDGRIRCASFSLRTKNMDSRKAKKAIMSVLGERRLPRGYTLEFDRDAIEDAEALSGTALLFAAALLLCFMVIGAVHESFTFPLGVLAAIPPSMALPALLLAGGGVQRADACAFIAVSGMAVNAAVLAAGAMRRGGLPAIGEALPHLWATTLTTVLGASPFIFFPPDTYRLVHSLAVAGALGVGASFLCALSLIPALGALFPGMFGKGRETINDER